MTSDKPGRIRFDERGNAVFEWVDSSLTAEGKRAEQRRVKALTHPGLSLMDEARPPEEGDIRNERGLKVGYNPYESGMLSGKRSTKKRDMRALSNWIQLKKKLGSPAE